MVSTGGGIVAKSNEEYELQEVNNKLGALKKAIILAEQNVKTNHHENSNYRQL